MPRLLKTGNTRRGGSLLRNRRLRFLLPAMLVAVAVSVFVGTQYGGHSFASSTISWYFWDGGYMHANPDKYSCTNQWYCTVTDSYANGGTTHAIEKQVWCKDFPGSEVYDGSNNQYHNNWWGYLPYKGGWVNEVHFASGGNDKNSIPVDWITTWNIDNGNRSGAAGQGCGNSW